MASMGPVENVDFLKGRGDTDSGVGGTRATKDRVTYIVKPNQTPTRNPGLMSW